jgi:hypothetical protein
MAPPASAAPRAVSPHGAADTLRLFDCLLPFFAASAGEPSGDGVTNWSKIPFADLERDGVLDPAKVATVLTELDRYVATMAGLGYNAVAIDDLAHLVDHAFYPAPLRRKLASYRRLYDRVFATVKGHGLRLFAITDYLFLNEAIEGHLRERRCSEAGFFVGTVRAAFAAFPQIDGVVLRIGEGDGVDVEGDFRSRPVLRRPRETRELLERLLPVFERAGKTLVFRTWTLGAHQVGDLMWNRRTYDAVFQGIASPSLVVSLKYGDADFFRYLDLNPLFFHGPQQKIIELQCRREYEGMGEYPSFVGWCYAAYLAALRSRPNNVVGMFAIQGGGWGPFAKLAYCGDGSLWNELNTYVAVKLFAGDASVEEIVADFCAWRGIADPDRFCRLLALSDGAIEDGLYVRAFASHPIYFRRVRIPPSLWVFWDSVTVGGIVGHLYRHLVRDREAAVAEGYAAVERVREMARLAGELGLPEADFRFQLDTFLILAHLREVLFALDTPETRERLAALIAAYQERYPRGYRFDTRPASLGALGRPSGAVFRLLLRHEMRYRWGDGLLLNRHVTRLKVIAAGRMQASLPRFVNKQGMTADALLR